MHFFSSVLPLVMAMQQMESGGSENRLILFDFTTANNVNDWVEISDTVREVGMSKAVITLQKTQLFQRAIFFTLLNPQPNGAGFAGVETRTDFNLTDYDNIEITCRAQGNNNNYKIILRDPKMSEDPHITYEQFFSVTPSNEFTIISLNVSNFEAYFRGRRVPDAEPLDTSNIAAFGLQIYGGVYSPIKQSGVSSLEINTIAAVIL